MVKIFFLRDPVLFLWCSIFKLLSQSWNAANNKTACKWWCFIITYYLLCSCKPIFSPLAFVLDLHGARFPRGTLNLAHCANYLWKEAHSHNHQFHRVLKLSWASPGCAPFPMKDGDPRSWWSWRVHLQYSWAPHPSSECVYVCLHYTAWPGVNPVAAVLFLFCLRPIPSPQSVYSLSLNLQKKSHPQ